MLPVPDQWLFYGGLIMIAAAILLGFLSFLLYKYRRAKLELRHMKEFG